MPVIQITNAYKGEVLELVKKLTPEGFEIRVLTEASTEALIECVGEADYILASGRVKINEDVLAAAKKLKMIQRTGVGLDSLDLEAIGRHNIPVYVNGGVNSESVAEYTILLILACLRKLCIINENTKKGIWKKQAQGITTFELASKKVGLIGLGNIGRNAARLLSAFGADVCYYDTFRQSEETEKELGIRYVPFEQLMAESDIISLHCPLTSSTRNIICEKSLMNARDGVIIVNTARGGLINEDDLAAALDCGKVGFAALDVHSSEPCGKGDRLLGYDRVIATPHIGGVTYDSFSRMIGLAMRNIEKFENGEIDFLEEFLLR